jgi:hypothetical protein
VIFDNEAFAAAINQKMFANRCGQNKLAKKLDISVSTMCRIVTHRKDASPNNIATILSWLEIPFEFFVRK